MLRHVDMGGARRRNYIRTENPKEIREELSGGRNFELLALYTVPGYSFRSLITLDCPRELSTRISDKSIIYRHRICENNSRGLIICRLPEYCTKYLD